MSVEISTQMDGDIAVISISNPPVNALSADVRKGLCSAVEKLARDPKVNAIVLHGDGRVFIGGADIKEFGKPPTEPTLASLCHCIETCQKPVIAALHGVALGGGFEVALCADYRIALSDTKIGFPEIHLGLLPGSGGTQRATRIAGVKASLDLMLTGRHAMAEEMLQLGLIDEISDLKDSAQAGIVFARRLLEENRGVRPTKDRTEGLADEVANRAALDEARAVQAKQAKHLYSPFRIIDAVEGALNLPFDEALKNERALFMQCIDSPQCRGLIHAFFAERAVSKSPETAHATPRDLKVIGIIGGGTMGAGIAGAVLNAGLPVIMIERDDESIARGRANVEKIYTRMVAKGRMSQPAMDQLMNEQFTGSTEYSSLKDADLIIEAVFEDMDVKKSVFAELGKVAKPKAILATNTSYLDIDELAATTQHPENVIGLHFFSPANIMKLLEIVVADKTSAEVVATSFALGKKLRKVAVRAGVCDGFIGNRILGVYRQAADHMMEDGASPYAIDQALRDFGYPMGPYQVSDLAGGDIGWATRKRKAATRDPKARYVHIADKICERGWFGQKTARGYYVYENGSRTGTPDPEVEAIIDEARQEAGITTREFTSEQILQRYIAAMVNEGANVIADKIALRPLDVDITLLYGYGFPRWRGGPMKYADEIGLDKILADIQTFAKEDPVFWKPSPLLVELVAKGDNFESLNTL